MMTLMMVMNMMMIVMMIFVTYSLLLPHPHHFHWLHYFSLNGEEILSFGNFSKVSVKFAGYCYHGEPMLVIIIIILVVIVVVIMMIIMRMIMMMMMMMMMTMTTHHWQVAQSCFVFSLSLPQSHRQSCLCSLSSSS